MRADMNSAQPHARAARAPSPSRSKKRALLKVPQTHYFPHTSTWLLATDAGGRLLRELLSVCKRRQLVQMVQQVRGIFEYAERAGSLEFFFADAA